jgi:predicted TIM-barrel fold metal-dependent hydrolase
MIIDLHTHVWMSVDQLGNEVAARLRTDQLQHWGQLDASPAAHERAMSCVDGALVIGFRSDRLGAHVPNEYIADFVAKDPRRRIGAAGIDPLSADAMDEFEAAIDLGLCAIAVSPACQGFHPAHSAAMRIYERCLEASMPLFVTHNRPLTASSELEFARPVHWDEVARAFPDLPIVISQLGYPWTDETLTLLGKHQNMWADISFVASRPWQLYHALLNALSSSVMDRLLFGSGFPHEMPARAIEALYRVNSFSHGTQLPAVPRAQVRGIVERDAITCLGIEPVFSARVANQTQRDAETDVDDVGAPAARAGAAPPADDD